MGHVSNLSRKNISLGKIPSLYCDLFVSSVNKLNFMFRLMRFSWVCNVFKYFNVGNINQASVRKVNFQGYSSVLYFA